jgi:hypothetical protein
METRVWNYTLEIRNKSGHNGPEGWGRPRIALGFSGFPGIAGNRELVLHRPLRIPQVEAPQRLTLLGRFCLGMEGTRAHTL